MPDPGPQAPLQGFPLQGFPLQGFPPIEGDVAHTLVLGTMPSVRSLELGQYYGHPRNAFWDVVEGLGIPRELDYAERCRQLTELGVAVWDVLAECEREGSLDAAIRAPRANDFAGFFDRHPELERIAFNGRAARTLFDRHVEAPKHVELVDLPSTSPANTQRGKVEVWRERLPLRPRLP